MAYDDLREVIKMRVFKRNRKESRLAPSHTASGKVRILSWIFDFRMITLESHWLNRYAEIFWEKYADQLPFQVGGMETAALPLISAIVMKGAERGTPVNGFFIRKSRKKSGLTKHIEGTLTNEPVVLVDDSMNSGKTFERQLLVLKEAGKKVSSIFIILRYRPREFYSNMPSTVRIDSLFTLDDFPESGGILKIKEKIIPDQFRLEWKFQSAEPLFHVVAPKSAPILDDEHLYFGSDNGTMWALNQADGSIVWHQASAFRAKRNPIFSSPALSGGMLYFGSNDGNFYALDARTGRKQWVFLEADWIGSSPCIAEDLGMVFVGLEFGLFKKQGGLVALDIKTGKKYWSHRLDFGAGASPVYSKKLNTVFIGGSSGAVCAFRANDGKPLWTFSAGGAVRGGFALDETPGLLCFGSADTYIYALDASTGTIVHKIEAREPVWSTPLAHEGKLYFGLLDKRVVCINLKNGKMEWKFDTGSRVFASPTMIDGILYIGANDGKLYGLDRATGKELSSLQFSERIVNKVAHNSATKQFFVPTFANEMYCIIKKEAA